MGLTLVLIWRLFSVSTKADVSNSPQSREAALARLEKLKAIEAKRMPTMTTVRLNNQTVVSCANKSRIDGYKKSLSLK